MHLQYYLNDIYFVDLSISFIHYLFYMTYFDAQVTYNRLTGLDKWVTLALDTSVPRAVIPWDTQCQPGMQQNG